MLRELALLAALLAVSAAARLQVDEPMGSSLDDLSCSVCVKAVNWAVPKITKWGCGFIFDTSATAYPGKKKINSAISLAQDGLYGKACQTLISSGVALNNRLRTVLQHLAAASFTLKASKCHSKSKIKYLGHIVSKQGIRKDPDKVSAMLEFPVPTDLKQFVDLSRHYSRFIKGFSSIAEPLHKLSRKSQIEADSGLDVEGSRTRPADILLPNWEFGKPAALDFTITSALNPSTLNEASVMAGSAASAAEVRKHVANDEKCSRLGWVCIPLSVETYGCWGEEAGRCLDRLATRIATRTGCPKSSAVSGLYGRLSIGLIRANARALLARSSSLS
ncbi:hypothetical protein EMCRGX_G008957 [Ephydatia muelleri]